MNIAECAAIITGGGSGMGFAAGQMLRAKGARVALLGRRAELVERKARDIGAVGIACDITDIDSVRLAFAKAEEINSTARILINAAADGSMFPLLEQDGSAFPFDRLRAILETNVIGTLQVNQVFASRLSRAQPLGGKLRGVIINVSSIGAEDGVVGSAYVMSKAAVNGLCLSLARELGAWGIRVMTIAPGAIDTEMLRAGANEQTYSLIASSIPGVERVGSPQEFAALACHVCENDYLNASVIRLDGGMRIPFVLDVGGGSSGSGRR